jgi:hypothetical protein
LLAWALLAACEFPSYEVDRKPTAEGGSASGGSAGAPATPDPCVGAPCEHGGRCLPVEASFVCLCAPGFRGDRCELTFDNCDPDPCQNGGVCVDGDDSSFCNCIEGWEGATCQLSVNDCAEAPCQNDGVCVDGLRSFSCKCQPGFLGDTCQESLPATCRQILEADAAATGGVYLVDPDGPGRGQLPLEVLCDMTNMDGGWTMVGQERAGDTGTFKFLGISVGDPSRAARYGDSALVGERFQGLYEEVRIGWASEAGDGAVYFRVGEEIFSNTVRKTIPMFDFGTSDATLNGWVQEAGGALLCRGSASPDVRPGDTSWAILPRAEEAWTCGCSSHGWQGRGGFYGGHPDANSCNPHGGGWSGITDNGVPKGDIAEYGLQFWIR